MEDNAKPQLPSAAEALRDVVALVEMSDAAIAELAAIGTLHNFPVGTVLFHEGDRHDRLYFVTKGTVNLDMVTTTSGAQTLLSIGSGELLAWSSLIGDNVMTATAVVAEDTQAVVFDSDELQRLADAKPEMGYEIMRALARALSRRLLATRLQLLDLYEHPHA
jgi:CRP-like cAMP-binding protein